MEKSRVTVEWHFGEVKRYWTLVGFKCNLLVRECAVGALHVAETLLTNISNCC